ncbi:hypothetical protein LLS47_07170 [Rouxiella badensis]|uniref:hypothetical protein n=1 Tax=Rouxiella badensis TaxID=1646377 RepID=UPI001D1370DE|nr:hypothetical protein [Rouxiella badensis]MCC3732711.1 hypothetical protein [Rouxiella badensis]MCC3758557.1 hypothetical protein [Rouxiella badensis]
MKKLWLLILCPSVLLTALAAHAEVPGKAIDQKIEACSKKAVSTLDSEACLQQGYTDWDKELNEWKGLPLIMRLINSCAIMG